MECLLYLYSACRYFSLLYSSLLNSLSFGSHPPSPCAGVPSLAIFLILPSFLPHHCGCPFPPSFPPCELHLKAYTSPCGIFLHTPCPRIVVQRSTQASVSILSSELVPRRAAVPASKCMYLLFRAHASLCSILLHTLCSRLVVQRCTQASV